MKGEPKFLTPLVVTPLSDGFNWRVERDLKFQDATGDLHVVHAGFITDFASIPSLSRLGGSIMYVASIGLLLHLWIAAILLLLGFCLVWFADDFNGDDGLDAPAALHDEGYRRPRLGKSAWTLKLYWDWILFTALRANGEPLWKCWLIWANVTAFGWFAWYQDGGRHD